jgi:hypothetical protein
VKIHQNFLKKAKMEVELTSSDVECPYTSDSPMDQVLYDFNFWCEGVVGCMIYIPG